MLARLIQEITGLIFEKYIRNNILKPLDMNQSSFLKSEIKSKYKTSPHILTKNENNNYLSIRELYPYNRIHAPSGTLHSNVNDMCNWLLMWLNNGEYKVKRILTSPSCELMINEHLGWHGGKFINHGGADIGYRSFICFVPKLSLGIVVLVNSDNIKSKSYWIPVIMAFREN